MTRELIESRERTLEESREYLKTQFIGIDDIIDKFIDSVRIWFLMPEVMNRPLIVNLFGITGVGKTDLVRKFVTFVGKADKFCEIQLDSREGSSTVQDYLEMVFADEDEHGVLLLDEIQRFRSISEDGMEKNTTKYQDIWMLLSDGTFESNSKVKNDLLGMILDDAFWSERQSDNKDDKTKAFKMKTSFWMARRLKKLLRTTESVEDIMLWDDEQRMQRVKLRLQSTDAFSGAKYRRLLIVISGNLDEAFRMAGNVEDADVDADVYHEHSKRVDMVTIKKALMNRFKPEQIARFGNIHLVYPILSRASYMGIIKQKCADICNTIMGEHGISIQLDQSVYDVIYQNGVFPAQGVRPVISTISSILENSLPTFVFKFIKAECNRQQAIHIKYHDGSLWSEIAGEITQHQVPTVLDDIKSKKSKNWNALVAVHEAGHAVVYAVVNRMSPTQVVGNTSNNQIGGFVGQRGTFGSSLDMRNDICVSYGARAAELLVFGEELINSGGRSDHESATATAAIMTRLTGMAGTHGTYATTAANKGEHLVGIEDTDRFILDILNEQFDRAVSIIGKNQEFLYDVVSQIMKNSKISCDEFYHIAKRYIPDMIRADQQELCEQPYTHMLEEWKNTIKRQDHE